MKVLLTTLPILIFLGCSNAWSTNPQDADQESAAISSVAETPDLENALDDVEPPDPPCLTNQTGFVSMKNPSGRTVTCQIGSSHTYVLEPNTKCNAELPIGAYVVNWWPNENTHYQTSVVVLICERSSLSFNPALACKAESQS
jgi:hypothetical protein